MTNQWQNGDSAAMGILFFAAFVGISSGSAIEGNPQWQLPPPLERCLRLSDPINVESLPMIVRSSAYSCVLTD